jgi:non-canonical poly(A) RNA polymerase PAPD5/7
MYQFRGASDTSYRPRSPPRYSYAPGISPPRGPATDTYRPYDPPSDFTFRREAPPSLDFRQAPYRPRSPPHQRNNSQESHSGNRQYSNANNNQGATRGGYRGRGGPRMASDREFLRGNRAPTPELMPGMDDDQENAIKYMPIEDVSDSDEAEMDLSDDEGEDEAQQPKQKQTRTETLAADGDSVPKWSNPDPYTALPPPDESQRKKRDVVKLIRKARVTATSENISKTEAVSDDFISFDFGEDDQDDKNMFAQQSGAGVIGAPTGPRFNHRDNAHKQDQRSGSLNQSFSYNAAKVPHQQERASRPERGQSNAYQAANSREGHDRSTASKMQDSLSGPVDQSREILRPQNASQRGDDYKKEQMPAANIQPMHANLPNEPAAQIDLTADPALGNRKRTIRDEIKGPLKNPPVVHESSKGKKSPVNGEILKAWKVKDGVSPTPWLSIDHSDSANMGVW